MIKRLTMWHARAGVPREEAVHHWLSSHVPVSTDWSLSQDVFGRRPGVRFRRGQGQSGHRLSCLAVG